MSSGFPIDPQVPDELVQLGIAFGLITPPPDQTLNTDWFGDPLEYLGQVLTNRDQRDAAIALAESAFGRARDELDLPVLPEDEEWIPIVDDVNGNLSVGLYTVVEPSPGEVKLSLGARVSLSQPDLELALTLKVPLLRATDSIAAELLIGTPGNPLDITARVDILPDGLDAGPVGLRGACIQARLPTAPGDEPALDFILKGLRLPDQAPRDLPLSELADDLGPETVNIVLALLRTQATIPAKVDSVLELLGLGGAGSPIPALPVDELIAQGQAALSGWFRQIAADATKLRAWFEALAGLLDIAAVNGSGTADDPLRIALAAASWSPQLVLWTTPDPVSGAPVLRAGARFELDTPAASPVPANSTGRGRAEIDFFTITLAASPAVQALPRLNVLVELDSSGAARFLDVTPPAGPRVQLRTLRLGLALDAARRPIPLIEALDVTIGSDTYPVLDLTSADAVQEAAANALDDVIGELLDLLGVTASDEGRAVAALAGFIRPGGVGAGDPWPALVALPAFFADPLGEIGCYHQRVLEQPNAWAEIAAELALLLRAGGVAAPSIAGSGTEADPWTATLFDNRASADAVRGVVAAQLFTAPGTDGDTHLRAAVETRPLIPPLNGTELAIVYGSDIVDLGLGSRGAVPADAEPELGPAPARRDRVHERHRRAGRGRALSRRLDGVRADLDAGRRLRPRSLDRQPPGHRSRSRNHAAGFLTDLARRHRPGHASVARARGAVR